MNEDLPFAIEYAKSGRASCKKCKENIAKDAVRMAVMVQSHLYDGKMALWHHLACFFQKKNKLTSTSEIANFNNLRWEDQEKVKKLLAGGSSKGKANNGSAISSENSDFSVEYAKSNKSTCRGCGEKITKNEVRISKLDDNPENQRYGPAPLWHHVECFIENKTKLQYDGSAEDLPGFQNLKEEDQDMLKKKLGSNGKKRKSEDDSPLPKAKVQKLSKEDKVLKEQNQMLFKMRDDIKKHLSKKDIVELLEYNKQHVVTGENRLMDHLADCLVFGGLKKCPECKSDRPRFIDNKYVCPGNLTEWTKCQYSTKYPERIKFNVPKEFQEEYPFLKEYNCVIRERQFPKEEAGPSKKNLPLGNFKIALFGKFKVPQDVMTKKLEGFGAKIQKTVGASVNLCISTQGEIDSISSKIQKAQANNIHVVSYDFLESISKGTSVAQAIKDNLLSSWGEDPILKFGIKKEHKNQDAEEEKETKSVSQKVKLTVKGAAAVDPESGLEHKCHVYQKKDNIYNAVLSYVDMSKGTNSFYKLQLLESNKGSKYHLFRQWGRVGTTIGGKKVETFSDVEDAIDLFTSLYSDKTGNSWGDRKNFVKQPGCMYPLDIDYGQDCEFKQVLKPGVNSKLPKPVQELICLIFDIEAMKKAMVEFEIDLKKMPLGKLSKKQIDSAYKVLGDAQRILQTGSNSGKISDVTNRFFTLIPHDFGMKKLPLLDNEEIIKSKIEMLDSLLEIEFAYSLIKGEQNESKDPVDEHYDKLQTDINPVEKDSKEYKLIDTYLKNTHAETHDQYKLVLQEVFKINRHGESEKYNKFKNLHNKKLLWHGSRLTNFVGILSQGLRIAPPEAPVTGYMFGKGVYFADMVSKSANYCWASKNNTTGLLLLCEVALGNMYERTRAEFVEKLPNDKHSTLGMGKTIPNPAQKTYMEDVEIPYGKPVARKDASPGDLLYNEFIVYDTNQINIKYLVKVDFKWTR